jgi:hypothetical protein
MDWNGVVATDPRLFLVADDEEEVDGGVATDMDDDAEGDVVELMAVDQKSNIFGVFILGSDDDGDELLGSKTTSLSLTSWLVGDRWKTNNRWGGIAFCGCPNRYLLPERVMTTFLGMARDGSNVIGDVVIISPSGIEGWFNTRPVTLPLSDICHSSSTGIAVACNAVLDGVIEADIDGDSNAVDVDVTMDGEVKEIKPTLEEGEKNRSWTVGGDTNETTGRDDNWLVNKIGREILVTVLDDDDEAVPPSLLLDHPCTTWKVLQELSSIESIIIVIIIRHNVWRLCELTVDKCMTVVLMDRRCRVKLTIIILLCLIFPGVGRAKRTKQSKQTNQQKT